MVLFRLRERAGLSLLLMVLSGAVLSGYMLPGCLFCKRTESSPSPSPSPVLVSDAATPSSEATSLRGAPRSMPGPLWGPGTFAVVAGVLSFENPSLTPFSARKRKDQEIYDALIERGVPRGNIRLLLDRAVTATAVRRALEDTARRAGPGSTLLFYYAGHGMRDGGGRPFFAAYDTGKDLAASAIALDDVTAILQSDFRGSRVLLMADCCYSGSLQRVARALRAKGVQTVSLTSADASNASTSNWTFSQSVLDALRGDALLDRNRDGDITLGELDAEVADAMKYREKQRHGIFVWGVPMRSIWAKARAARSDASSGPYPRGAYVEALRGGRWATARVVLPGPKRSLVRFYDYCESTDQRVLSSSLRKISFDHHRVGEKVQVMWGGKLWPAEVTAVSGDFHKITYPGWPRYWDEWVLSNRIAGPGGAH